MTAAPTLEAPHVLPRTSPMANWPVTLHIAVEKVEQAAYTWDDPDAEAIVWDAPTLEWDVSADPANFVDAVCDFVSLEVDPGEADALGLLPPAVLNLTLQNTAGQWTAWSADGRLVYWALGRRLYVWATLADASTYWIFGGRIAQWHERADGYVEVTAFDGLAELAQPITSGSEEWTAGAAGDVAYARIVAIAAAAGYTDTITTPPGAWSGDVPLKARPTSNTPLDECYVAALSDGGLFFADANGDLIYMDRRWRLGRPDQATVPTITDNVSDPAIADVWNVELALEDENRADYVELTNDDGLVAVSSAGGTNPKRHRLTHPDPDLWISQTDGDQLAAYLLYVYSRQAMRLRSFELNLIPVRHSDRSAPVTPWTVAAALRRGDLVRFVHDFVAADGTAARLDVHHRIDTVGHAITPEQWTATYGASPVITYLDSETWDGTGFTWDDTNPSNVWS
jgi:hypothetical protein